MASCELHNSSFNASRRRGGILLCLLGDAPELFYRRVRNYYLSGFKKALLQNPPRNDSGANFQRSDSDSGPKVRVTGRKSELQTKSRRYSPKSEPNRPEKGPEWGLGASTENPP